MPANRTYQLSPLAEIDLEAIWDFSSEQWSPDQAEIYLNDIFGAFAGLAAGQRLGRPVDVREGYFKYLVGSHVIFFRLSQSGIDVIRILHQTMNVDLHL
jgi:toxin ParE1/3/4